MNQNQIIKIASLVPQHLVVIGVDVEKMTDEQFIQLASDLGSDYFNNHFDVALKCLAEESELPMLDPTFVWFVSEVIYSGDFKDDYNLFAIKVDKEFVKHIRQMVHDLNHMRRHELKPRQINVECAHGVWLQVGDSKEVNQFDKILLGNSTTCLTDLPKDIQKDYGKDARNPVICISTDGTFFFKAYDEDENYWYTHTLHVDAFINLEGDDRNWDYIRELDDKDSWQK